MSLQTDNVYKELTRLSVHYTCDTRPLTGRKHLDVRFQHATHWLLRMVTKAKIWLRRRLVWRVLRGYIWTVVR